ncbi:arginine deiminase [Synergistaceae bacterium OttesenSCG-928-I11]|nr:arginine deiminase [Synergistaceae bacterium OttesenSCG-928-I11]
MSGKKDVYVGSEIGKLNRIFLHKPGKELKRITIDNKDELLIDEIVWVERAQQNHDEFAALLRKNGTEVVYFQDCLADVVKDEGVRSNLLDDALRLEPHDRNLTDALKKTVMEMTPEEVAETLVGGMTKKEAAARIGKIKSLTFTTADDYSFFFRPLPNLYFQRDPYFFVRDGVVLSAMRFLARQREPLYAKYIFKNHPLFKGVKIIFGDQDCDCHPNVIEGGDFLVLSEECVAIGVSQRSIAGTIQAIGSRLASEVGLKKVLAVDIPKERAYMHLDTVFTMVDRDAFTIYPGVHKKMRVWELSFDDGGKLTKITESNDVFDSLKKNLHLDNIRCIETGGGDPIEASRDQWNDGTNTFAIAPGVVVTYEGNLVSNRVLRDNGVSVYEINGSELGKGRGGPRCMSMPLKREAL